MSERHEQLGPTLGRCAAAVGKGLLAGLAGTAAMTLAQTLEMKINGREGSDMPAEAVTKTLGIRFADDESEERAAQAIHWLYGSALGGLRGLLDAAGLGNVTGTGAHFLLVWGGEAVTLPALGLMDPPTEQEPEQLATDAGFHALYALTTGAVYAWLDGGGDCTEGGARP